jgi:NAD(P)-dependent dehydrogenase (short-subunit alcohol dehydrogenase family)
LRSTALIRGLGQPVMRTRAAVTAFGKTIVADHPSLNVLVNNAGIMQRENLLTDPVDLTIAEATVATNLLGPLRLTARAFDLGDDGDGSRSPRFCGTYTSEGGPHDVRALIVILNEVWKYRADF